MGECVRRVDGSDVVVRSVCTVRGHGSWRMDGLYVVVDGMGACAIGIA